MIFVSSLPQKHKLAAARVFQVFEAVGSSGVTARVEQTAFESHGCQCPSWHHKYSVFMPHFIKRRKKQSKKKRSTVILFRWSWLEGRKETLVSKCQSVSGGTFDVPAATADKRWFMTNKRSWRIFHWVYLFLFLSVNNETSLERQKRIYVDTHVHARTHPPTHTNYVSYFVQS